MKANSCSFSFSDVVQPLVMEDLRRQTKKSREQDRRCASTREKSSTTTSRLPPAERLRNKNASVAISDGNSSQTTDEVSLYDILSDIKLLIPRGRYPVPKYIFLARIQVIPGRFYRGRGGGGGGIMFYPIIENCVDFSCSSSRCIRFNNFLIWPIVDARNITCLNIFQKTQGT